MNTVRFILCHKSATQANKKKIIAAFMKHSIQVCILTLDILVLDPTIAINIHLQISEKTKQTVLCVFKVANAYI